jgi:hypothetical protein
MASAAGFRFFVTAVAKFATAVRKKRRRGRGKVESMHDAPQ